MIQIRVAAVEFSEGGKAIWVHDRQGSTVLRIQCTGEVRVNHGCTNICAHADINVVGNIELCLPGNDAVLCPPDKSKRRARRAGLG